ncbi:MAG: hypothetical protein BGO01_06945 [Armatimonadetes bacterium 55-13]|nr:alpha/beta hydrolase [Armatimonadota bacterium]OJU62237.1 MAG: hypothetical protein BGO01_06945 [Armatimonadetes bacterium 55-13]
MMRRCLVLVVLLLSSLGFAQERIQDVIYLKQAGSAFTFDVFKPAKPTGAAVIFIVSGGWFSSHDSINPAFAKPLTDLGYTVFEVVHGSQPKYTIPEIVVQLRRAVRVIRADAKKYGIDPNRIGVTGGSAGGHLSLMLGGTPVAGNPEAKDPVERVGSEVQSVVAFFPPTDFMNWGKPDYQPYDSPVLQIFMPAFGVKKDATADERTQIAKTLSPITYVTSKFPPTLLIHGDKDMLVPIQQSQVMDAALAKAGVKHDFITVPGLGHDGAVVVAKMADVIKWFGETLGK